MNEELVTDLPRRNVNIESAIDKSSFQIPVFVAISAAGGEAQVVKTFATAREVFEHVFSILLDRLQQRRAVEAVANLVPQATDLTGSVDTEYVLLVRGKAIFWFSGAAAKRAAGRRLLLEHARDLATAEQAPFYVLNSRPKKVRAAIVATGLIVLIPVGYLILPYATQWTREPARRHSAPPPQPVESVERTSDQDSAGTVLGAGVPASVTRSSAARTETRPGPVVRAFDPEPGALVDRKAILTLEKRMAAFVRAWPDQFRDRLWIVDPQFLAETGPTTPATRRSDSAEPPLSARGVDAQATRAEPGHVDQARAPGQPTRPARLPASSRSARP